MAGRTFGGEMSVLLSTENRRVSPRPSAYNFMHRSDLGRTSRRRNRQRRQADRLECQASLSLSLSLSVFLSPPFSLCVCLSARARVCVWTLDVCARLTIRWQTVGDAAAVDAAARSCRIAEPRGPIRRRSTAL